MTKTSRKGVKEFAILIPTASRAAYANGPEEYASLTNCDVTAASMQSSPHEEEIRELA